MVQLQENLLQSVRNALNAAMIYCASPELMYADAYAV